MDFYQQLEEIRWKGRATCPYCNSTNITAMPTEFRHHCNTCNTSFSVTVGTLFHGTRLELARWFQAVVLVLSTNGKISSRQLAKEINVNKNTACRISNHIQIAMHDYNQRQILLSIAQIVSPIYEET